MENSNNQVSSTLINGLIAGLGGGWPALITALGAPLLLSLAGSKGEDAMTMRKKAMEFLDPYAIQREEGTQFANLLNSPMVSAAQSAAIQGGQVGAQAINSRLAQTGLGRSGVGMALEGAVRAAPGIQMAQMLAGLHDTASQRALEIQKMRAQQRMSGQPQNSMVREMGGAIMASILPAILNYKEPTTKTNNSGGNGTYGGTNIPVEGLRAGGRNAINTQFMGPPQDTYKSKYWNQGWDSQFNLRKPRIGPWLSGPRFGNYWQSLLSGNPVRQNQWLPTSQYGPSLPNNDIPPFGLYR